MIVDASLAVKWLVPEPGNEAALRLRATWLEKRVQLLAPALLLAEVANVLWQRVERGVLSAGAEIIQQAPAEWLPVELVDPTAFLGEALGLSVAHHISVYDAVYVAVARRAGAPLYTADEALRRRVPEAVARLRGIE